MTQVFEKAAELNRTNLAQVMKGVNALSKTNQSAGIEWADFAKESYAAGAETMKKLADARTLLSAVEQTFSSRVSGQEQVRTALLTTMLAEGHLLLESVPGLAKTLAASTLATSMGADSASWMRVRNVSSKPTSFGS